MTQNCQTLSLAALLLASFAAPARAEPVDAVEIARELGVSDDERRPEDQARTKLLGRDLIVGGQVETSIQSRSHYALRDGEDDSDISIEPEIKLEAIWLIDDDLVTFTDLQLFSEHEVRREGRRNEHNAGFELNEAWILKTGLFGSPFAIQVGRQQVKDRREWWWDDNLDMVRLHYFGDRITAFTGIGRDIGHFSTLGRREADERDIVRIVGDFGWRWADRQELHLMVLNHRDKSSRYLPGQVILEDFFDERDASLTWIGLSTRGRIKAKFPGKLYYWADIARLRGHERVYPTAEMADGRLMVLGSERRRVRGWGYDIGASLELPFAFEPYLTIGHARGSGGANTFRQTGLNGNNGKFRGNSRFRYYGEVLRPELSNISILTAALGVEPFPEAWLELVWHRYRQVTLSNELAGSRLDADPTGLSRKLGQEFDMIASYRPPSGWDFELTTGAFRAGSAFGSREGGWAWTFQAKVAKTF